MLIFGSKTLYLITSMVSVVVALLIICISLLHKSFKDLGNLSLLRHTYQKLFHRAGHEIWIFKKQAYGFYISIYILIKISLSDCSFIAAVDVERYFKCFDSDAP